MPSSFFRPITSTLVKLQFVLKHLRSIDYRESGKACLEPTMSVGGVIVLSVKVGAIGGVHCGRAYRAQ